MTQIKVIRVEQPEGKAYFKVTFSPLVNGHDSASVWEEKVLEGIKEGDTVEIEYKIKDRFMNITSMKVVKSEKPLETEDIKKIYQDCHDFMRKVWNDELVNMPERVGLSECVNTLFITIMRR